MDLVIDLASRGRPEALILTLVAVSALLFWLGDRLA